MSISLILLALISALVLLGVAQRVLDRMQLSDRAALLIAGLLFIGGLIPDIQVGQVSVNLGGAVVPIGVCVWLLIRADTGKEALRAIVGSVLTGAAVFALGRLLPSDPERMAVEPQYLYGLAGGLIAYILGRSRRNAFICGVMGIVLADVASALIAWGSGVEETLRLGAAGARDAIVISALLSVLLAEFLGEALERLSRRPAPERSKK